MKKVLLIVALLGVCFTAHAQSSPLLINGWNRFYEPTDATWWESNAHYFDDLNYDVVLHVLEGINFDVMDRVIAEDQKHHYQVWVTVDGTRNVLDVLKFFDKYGNLKNADGKPLIGAAIIGWDQVNNLHPDAPILTLKTEMQAAADLATTVNPDLPVYLTVSYSPGDGLAEWYDAMKGIPHNGIWLHNVFGYDADLAAPMAWLRDKGETNIILGNVYGFKYFKSTYRPDLITRSAKQFPRLFRVAKFEGYAGVCLTDNFDVRKRFGGNRFLDENGSPNTLYQAIQGVK